LDQKFPTVWEKMSENLRGDYFLTHTVEIWPKTLLEPDLSEMAGEMLHLSELVHP